MARKTTGKPPGRPRKDGLPAGSVKKGEALMAQDETKPQTESAAAQNTGAPETPITETPEFKAALESMKSELMSGVAMEMAKLIGSKPEAPAGQPTSAILSELTQMIAEMTNTGQNRKIIAPDEARKRVAAWDKMGALLERVRAERLQPHYVVKLQTWLDGVMVQPQSQVADGRWKDNEIIWSGAPNTAMRPLNDIAKQIYALFLESIGGTTQIEGMKEQPTWTTYGGLVMVGDAPPQSLQQRGNVGEIPEPATLTSLGNLSPHKELTSTDDRNATRIPVLGKTFPAAEVTAPGSIPTLQIRQ